VSRTDPTDPLLKRETDMKFILIFLILAASLGGCVVGPEGYDDNHGGFGHYEHGRDGGSWGHGS
jgi:hypothetical protein